MSEMVERVARAIMKATNPSNERLWDLLSEETRDHMRTEARAAITAMREPTQTMVSAAEEKANDYLGSRHERLDPEMAYQAMLDAALR